MLANRNLGVQNYETGKFAVQFHSDRIAIDRNPELIFFLNVFFRQGPTSSPVSDSDGGRTYAVDTWPENEWNQFKRQIISHSQRFWNGKFWLVPPQNCYVMNAPLSQRPTDSNIASSRQFASQTNMHNGLPNSTMFMYAFNMYCRVVIREVQSASRAHLTITAHHVNETDDGTFINSVGDGNGIFYNGILNWGSMTSRFGNTHLGQRQYLHEIGHALGQRHIGFYSDTHTCDESPYALARAAISGHAEGEHDVCYSGDNATEEADIMGSGEGLMEANATPGNILQHK